MIDELKVYQIIIFTFSTLLILKTTYSLISKKKTKQEWFVSCVVWLFIGLLGLFPNLSTIVAHFLGIEVGLNAIIVIALILIFFFLIKQFIINQDNEKTITQLTRELALKEFKLKKGNITDKSIE